MMKIAILGYGKQSLSAYEYWRDKADSITFCDSRTDIELPPGTTSQLGENYLSNLSKFDLIVRGAPVIHPRQIAEANPDTPEILDRVTSNTNEFFKVCPTRNIIGVTGTKGKGTTSALITKMLEVAGKRVHLGGNIGTAPLELLKNNIQPDDWVVLELANFQLIDLKSSPHIAVCLLVEPEHMDWHADYDEYVMAKQQLFRWQKSSDIAVFYADNQSSKQVVSVSAGQKLPYFASPGAEVVNGEIVIAGQQLIRAADLKLLGEHNWQNACAAVTAVWQVTKDSKAISTALGDFSGLPYRIELRAEKRGVKFYNDSFASQPEATIAAINAIPEDKVIIIGGYERGLSLERLADTVKRHEQGIQKVILVGASAARCSEAFEAKGFNNYVHESSRSMSAIVRRALDYARRGDAVVLSPGFASFDMFNNFEDRGNAFNEAVEKL